MPMSVQYVIRSRLSVSLFHNYISACSVGKPSHWRRLPNAATTMTSVSFVWNWCHTHKPTGVRDNIGSRVEFRSADLNSTRLPVWCLSPVGLCVWHQFETKETDVIVVTAFGKRLQWDGLINYTLRQAQNTEALLLTSCYLTACKWQRTKRASDTAMALLWFTDEARALPSVTDAPPPLPVIQTDRHIGRKRSVVPMRRPDERGLTLDSAGESLPDRRFPADQFLYSVNTA